ncbi:MAG: phytanoyl-CoA dioxygenase family protein [Actinomycetota bacterium]
MVSTSATNQGRLARHRTFFDSADDRAIDDLRALIDTVTPLEQYPNAAAIEREVVVYDMAVERSAAQRHAMIEELAHVFSDGPGVVVMRNAVAPDVVDRATAVFTEIIDAEKAAGVGKGDHFAAPGANERVWNALEKLAVTAPEVFVDYYQFDALAMASTAWLGPAYQVTSQLNVVNPGGVAQAPHRDYHLGFMTNEQAEQYPIHTHLLSPMLTLQGAVAHVDMPVESGPTMLLPHSHRLVSGYLAWRDADVIELFAQRHIQPQLSKGDAAFFNPAVFHGAGTNHTTGAGSVRRMGNLLQISSAMGIALEAVDRDRMCRAVFGALRDRRSAGWSAAALDRSIAATAFGYPFPTNLDRDPPIDGLAPPSQADVLRQAVTEQWTADELANALDGYNDRRRTH